MLLFCNILTLHAGLQSLCYSPIRLYYILQISFKNFAFFKHKVSQVKLSIQLKSAIISI